MGDGSGVRALHYNNVSGADLDLAKKVKKNIDTEQVPCYNDYKYGFRQMDPVFDAGSPPLPNTKTGGCP